MRVVDYTVQVPRMLEQSMEVFLVEKAISIKQQQSKRINIFNKLKVYKTILYQCYINPLQRIEGLIVS